MHAANVESLLTEICIELGFCLPAQEAIRLREDPPISIDAFVEAVFAARGSGAGGDLRLRRQVREKVTTHFRRWEDERTR